MKTITAQLLNCSCKRQVNDKVNEISNFTSTITLWIKCTHLYQDVVVRSTARVIWGQVLNIFTCGSRTHTDMLQDLQTS